MNFESFQFFEDHILLMFMKKKTGPGKQVQIIEVRIIKVQLYSGSSLTKCNRHSCKWTALLTAAFTKPHFNSHTNSVFVNPHKRLQIFLGFTSSIFALMSLNIRNEISFHYWMKTCEKYVKYPVTRKHPVKKPVNFAPPKFFIKFQNLGCCEKTCD